MMIRLATVILLFIGIVDFSVAADRFWVGGTGNWNNTANWSATSGGAGGASVPGTADDVYFDTLSFSAPGQIVTININASCRKMSWTLATNAPTITGLATFNLTIAGDSLLFIDGMTYSFAGPLNFTSTGNIVINLSDVARTVSNIDFNATSTRTININGNGAHSFGRITVGNNSTVNINGSGDKTYNGYFCGSNVLTTLTGNATFTDTLQTGYDNDFFTAAASVNSFQVVLPGEIDNGSRNHRFFGTNTFNGRVTTATDYQNTDRLHFYNSTFRDVLTIPGPDGRARFFENSIFEDTVFFIGSARLYDVDTFRSVAHLNSAYLRLSESNTADDFTVFMDSVYLRPNGELRTFRNTTFNGPVRISGGTGTAVRRFNDGAGTTVFNDRVYVDDNAGTSASRYVFERQTNFNDKVIIGDNTFFHFNDGNGATVFADSLTMGNGNTIWFERTVDFDSLLVGELNFWECERDVDFNRDAVFGDTNTLEFNELGGEVDVSGNLSFGAANDITFFRRYDQNPAPAGDSLLLGRLTTAEFLNTASNNRFENLYVANEARATFRNGTNTFVDITINDFSTIELSAGGTNTVSGTFTANESCESPPIVRSGTGGNQATIDFTGSAQTWSSVILQDLAITTSNLLTVNEAVDNGNLSVLDNTTPTPGPPAGGTTIWLTNERPGTTLFWVGTDGVSSGNFNWTNRFNWSTTSGGNGLLNTCIPNALDNVVFDANSFTAAGQQVVIDASFVVCNDMTWSGVTTGAELVGNTTNTIFIVEDLVLDANMTNNFLGEFEFLADDGTTRSINSNGVAFQGPINFNYEGGNWEFANDVDVNGSVTIIDGTVNTSASNYDLTIMGANNDLIIENTGILNASQDSITIPDDLLMSEDAEINITVNGVFEVGDDMIMNDSADFSHEETGNLTVGGDITMRNDAVLTMDTINISVGGNISMNNNAILTFDSCAVTIGSSLLGVNDITATLGSSTISTGLDVYLRNNSVASMSGGSITCADDFFLDENSQFTSSNNTLIVNGDDFFMDDNTIFTGTNDSIRVNGDDWHIRRNSQFTLNSGSLYADDDFRIENTAVLTANGTSTITVNDDFDFNGGTLNANGTYTMDVADNFDMDGGTYNANAANIFVGLTWDLVTGAVFNEGTSTVTFDDVHDNVSIRTRGDNFYNLVINKIDSSHDVRIINNSFIVRNNLTILRGELYDSNEGNDGPYQITGNTTGTGTLTVTATGSMRLGDNDGGSDAPTTFPTSWPIGNVSLDQNSTIHYRQRGVVQTISSFPTYGNLTMDNSGNVIQSKVADGAVSIQGRWFMDDDIQFADSGFQVVGNANAGTEFEMDPDSEFLLGSASTATTLPSFPTRDWDQVSTINYAAGVPQTVVSITGGTGNSNSYGQLTISNVAPSPTLIDKQMAGEIRIRRALRIQSNANLVDAGFQIIGNNSGSDVTMQANSQLTIGTPATPTLFPTVYTSGNINLDVNSTVVYNSNTAQDISDNPTYGNLQLSSSAPVTKSLTGNTDIDGDLTIDAQNTLSTTGSNFNINLAGDWINNGTYTPNSARVTIDGAGLSTLSGSTLTSFFNLTINSTAPDSALEMNRRAHVTNQLTLTNGVISTTTGNEIVVLDNATSSSGSNASHVDGPMLKVGDDVFDFPVGDAGKWARIGITDLQNSPTATDTFTAQYVRGLHPEAFWDSLDYVGDNDDLHNTSVVEYWDLNRLAGTVRPKLVLYWADNTESFITDRDEVVVAHYVGGNTWVNEGGTASGTLPDGAVTSVTNLNSFSPFTFGSTSGLVNPLPIELLSFTAVPDGNAVRLDWTTLTEINNDFFTIERSLDARNFEPIIQVDGAGSDNNENNYVSFDENPFDGISYYRLKQTDFDGKFSYSQIAAVQFSKDAEITVYPNPYDHREGRLFIERVSGIVNDFELFHSSGKLVKASLISDGPRLELLIDEGIAPGIYIININSNNKVYTQKIVIQ